MGCNARKTNKQTFFLKLFYLQICKESSTNYIIINVIIIFMKKKNFTLTIQLNFL